MPLGSANPVAPIKVGDSAELYAALRTDGQPVSPDQIAQVNFTIQDPNAVSTTDIGVTLNDGRGFYRWTNTTTPGVYKVRAQFTLVSGEVRSVMDTFAVTDPFADAPAPTYTQLITQAVWLRLQDTFDAVEGGPWLREKSLSNFDENKIAQFIPESLLDINVQMPPTSYVIDNFCAWTTTPGDNPNMPILVKGVLVLTIRHLMRSYVEQPTPMGAQVVWNDRTRYTQLWNAIYQVEYQDFIQAVRLWKRTTLQLGRSALSIYSKSGRSGRYGTNQAARGIQRGYF